MTWFLDSAIGIGVIIVAIQLCDVLLGPAQIRRLDASFETLTLYLEYTRPLRLLSKLRAPRVVQLSIIIGIGCFLIFGVLYPERLGLNEVNANYFSRYAYMLLPLLPLAFVSIWRSDNNRWRTFVVCFYLFVYSVGISFSLDFALLERFGIGKGDSDVRGSGPIGLPDWLDPNLIVVVVSFATTFAVAFVPLLAARLFLLAAAGLLWLLEQLIRGLRFLAWRIVAYRKGSVTGMIVIITAALTVFRLYLAR